MKIAHACIRFDAPGGAEDHVRAATAQLARLGHENVVHASDLYSERPWVRLESPSASVDGVRVVRHKVYRNLLPGLAYPVMPTLLSALREEGADVLHGYSHPYFQLQACALVSQATGTPFVVTPFFHPTRDADPWWKRGLGQIALLRSAQSVYAKARRVLLVTEGEREFLRGIVPEEKCTVVPTAIDPEPWEIPVEPARDPWEAPVWLYAGRLAENKGLHLLLHAFAAERRRRGRGTLLFLGADGGQLSALQALSASLGIGPHVRFLGYAPFERYRAIFARADVFVLPSEWESFGIVLLEAWAAGIPIVASRRGGIPWVVDDGANGLLFPYENPAALASAAARVLDDRGLAQSLVNQGRRKLAAQFTWDRVARRLESVYREVTE